MEPANGRRPDFGGEARTGRQADDLEITLEANPNSVEAARFADLAAAGVNRLSLGLQSFDDANLAFLGRAHSADEGQRALDIAQANFSRVSFDLIYALPGETEAGWSATLDRALGKGTSHLSLYQLTIEPGTRFASMVAKQRVRAARRRCGGVALFELTRPHGPRPPASPATKSAIMRAPGAGKPPQPHLLALRRLCWRRPRRARPAAGQAHSPPPQAREFPVGNQAQPPRHGRGRSALIRRSGGRGAGHGAASVRRRGPAGSCLSVREARRRQKLRSTASLQADISNARKTGYARRRPVGCCSTAFLQRLRRPSSAWLPRRSGPRPT